MSEPKSAKRPEKVCAECRWCDKGSWGCRSPAIEISPITGEPIFLWCRDKNRGGDCDWHEPVPPRVEITANIPLRLSWWRNWKELFR